MTVNLSVSFDADHEISVLIMSRTNWIIQFVNSITSSTQASYFLRILSPSTIRSIIHVGKNLVRNCFHYLFTLLGRSSWNVAACQERRMPILRPRKGGIASEQWSNEDEHENSVGTTTATAHICMATNPEYVYRSARPPYCDRNHDHSGRTTWLLE